jgi:diguanylate cyclase (GGDEF)-like protein
MPTRAAAEAAFLTIPRRIAYSLLGAALAMGAPLGLLCVNLISDGQPSFYGIQQEIASEPLSYAYVLVSTMLVFGMFGWFLGRQADRLIDLSTTDDLTGLLNARGFYQRPHQELARAQRSREPLSLFILDLDDLKSINDHYGHEAGDRALRVVATTMRETLRATDIGARVGGDEFMLLAPNTGAVAGVTLAQRIRTQAAEKRSQLPGLATTISVGVATFDPGRGAAVDAAGLTRAADEALYDAKREGGNRVCAVHVVRNSQHLS